MGIDVSFVSAYTLRVSIFWIYYWFVRAFNLRVAQQEMFHLISKSVFFKISLVDVKPIMNRFFGCLEQTVSRQSLNEWFADPFGLFVSNVASGIFQQALWNIIILLQMNDDLFTEVILSKNAVFMTEISEVSPLFAVPFLH